MSNVHEDHADQASDVCHMSKCPDAERRSAPMLRVLCEYCSACMCAHVCHVRRDRSENASDISPVCTVHGVYAFVSSHMQHRPITSVRATCTRGGTKPVTHIRRHRYHRVSVLHVFMSDLALTPPERETMPRESQGQGPPASLSLRIFTAVMLTLVLDGDRSLPLPCSPRASTSLCASRTFLRLKLLDDDVATRL